jgi:CHAD domain-containing protein
MSSHPKDSCVLEVERKFSVDGSFVVPELAVNGWSVVTGSTVELDATYYDTTDLRLARAHITLRRRKGGKDAGWHLKLPAGAEREEIQHPLGRGTTVPRDLADLVFARTRGLPLAPVARILTTRALTTVTESDGTPLVEIADDEVTGERLGDTLSVSHWREVEAELLAPGHEKTLAAVAKRLRRAGASRSPSASKLAQTLGQPATGTPAVALPATLTAGDAVTAYLAGQVEALLAADPRVRRELDDAVHAMRVASRRLRSGLQAFAPLLDSSPADSTPDATAPNTTDLSALETELKWLAGVLGEARDGEVLQARLRAQLDALPDELVLGPVRARLLDEELGGGQLRAHSAVLAALRSPRYLALLDSLDALAAAPPLTAAAAEPAATVLPRLARKAWKRLDRQAAHAIGTGVDADFHETRKAAKRARYTVEALEPVLGSRAARLANTAKDVQTVLGDHQDSVLARTMLRQLAINEAQAFSYGLLYAAELRRGEESSAQFVADWPRAADRARRTLAKLGG